MGLDLVGEDLAGEDLQGLKNLEGLALFVKWASERSALSAPQFCRSGAPPLIHCVQVEDKISDFDHFSKP